LVFSGGHLHHQVIDYESDLKSSVKTLAVWWGVAKTEFGSLLLFTLAAIIWLRYFNLGMIGNEEFVPLMVAYLIQAATFIRYRNRLYQDRIDYRSGYRFIYFSAFVLVAILKLWKL
jgi:4-hydroxybenzoate polyprenyltransferase